MNHDPSHASPIWPTPASRQRGVRAYNERALLQAVRQNQGLVAADLARLTGLTAQTVSTITRRLVDEGLLQRGTPRRGKVGQPGLPLTLNPDGAFALGFTLDRRRLETLLVDFTGQVRHRWQTTHHHPEPAAVLAHMAERLQALPGLMGADAHTKLLGVGLAAPRTLDGWAALLDMPSTAAQAWRGLDLRGEVARLTPLTVLDMKDTVAACLAEGLVGPPRGTASGLYIYIDTFVGGTLVVDGRLHLGRDGNAGAVGSMPLAWANTSAADAPAGQAAPPPQLLQQASLLNLTRALQAAGLDGGAAGDERVLQAPWAKHSQAWVQQSAAALAMAIASAAALLALDHVVVDGHFSRDLQRALLQALPAALDRLNWQGMARPTLLAGAVGAEAKALGAALWPLHHHFAPDSTWLLQPLPSTGG
jgi:predicted NBD/HSP70 family sugar kinase